ncbi:MAG: bifunctional UDP-N-acetylglucosamine diphosphorylase/glucosamine-1-phosphate N-acetyltransferase GlmU [Micrococcales bacterium]|nr:bifunctional UDP-N-acetylglucosamine diphosphorylase/glucosamine-1-phosphate N-acetyltransferase GlmU [Micrococcales bacterium]
MKSTIPKVLHTIGGRSLLGHALDAARGAKPEYLEVVVRHQRDRVAAHLADVDPEALIVDQDEIKGTGRAVECALDALPGDVSGTVLVTMGDVPLLTGQTLAGLAQEHADSGGAVTLVTATVPDPTGLRRILRGADGRVTAIVEEKDATDEQRAIAEVNTGIYAFDAAFLRSALSEVGTDNAQGEKYLTDVLAIAHSRGQRVKAHLVADRWQTEGVNDKVQLARLGAELNRRTVERAMREGAIVIDPSATWIDSEVSIGRDTIVHPGTQILGATTIGSDCVIGPGTTLTDVEVGDGASVVRTQAQLAQIGDGASVGPFSYLRPGTRLGARGKIGAFVETKNAVIEQDAKVPHLTYCGDASIGTGANIGAGTVFANYDGLAKEHTDVGAHSFVGSNSVIVAPRTIGAGAYVAAGSAVVSDVAPGQLAVTRAQQRNIDGWVHRRRPGTKTDEAAQAAEAHSPIEHAAHAEAALARERGAVKENDELSGRTDAGRSAGPTGSSDATDSEADA